MIGSKYGCMIVMEKDFTCIHKSLIVKEFKAIHFLHQFEG